MSGLKRDRGQWPSRDNSLVDPIECLQSHVNTDRGPQGLDKIKNQDRQMPWGIGLSTQP